MPKIEEHPSFRVTLGGQTNYDEVTRVALAIYKGKKCYLAVTLPRTEESERIRLCVYKILEVGIYTILVQGLEKEKIPKEIIKWGEGSREECEFLFVIGD